MKGRILSGNLRRVLLVRVALPVLLILALILSAGQTLISNFIEERMQRDLQLVARAVYLPVSHAMARNDLEQMQSSMASLFGMTEVYGAYLFDAEGQPLISFGVVNPTQKQAEDALQKTLAGEFDQYERIRGRDVYSFFMPMFDAAGQPNGLLQVTRRHSDIGEQLKRLAYGSWAGFGFISLLILGILVLTHQGAIGRPLERILRSIQRVEAGDHGHRAAVDGPSEIRQLAAGLNGMLDAIQQAEAREQEQRLAREVIAERLRQTETLAALGQLSAGVAHELGAPLSVVDGRASRLQRRLQDDRDIHELDDIRQQIARMASIIQQLLSYGRSSRAKPRPLDLAALLRRSQSLIAGEGFDVEVESGPEAMLMGDSLSLEQALINLLRNACQACPEGPVRMHWKLDQKIHVYIEDAGPGVDPGLGEQIFEPFVTTKTPGQGSGLGLAIVKRIVEEHGGQILVRRSELGGACFELVLPLETPEQEVYA
ncbi:Serine/Threonine protein kinase and Signal Transduction Histidine Kinase (STHK) with GAF and PAS/PAC sensor [Nitrincola lacisaponensis]|uniref:histidine kinase n=1 Tax=Nitrincola lacisaponensis TaxID=267850 RepID=A0A063Y7B1_9GAMM|nr:ATP-binding protein [Nitrincola lacisaponensis]KDE40980.1 Serine/Threonine protein kinase and Signal Transduction Histidine Kinase (STHK) with GAF and PAS/PAC sensor [Nitrincola lacisaponensis]